MKYTFDPNQETKLEELERLYNGLPMIPRKKRPQPCKEPVRPLSRRERRRLNAW